MTQTQKNKKRKGPLISATLLNLGTVKIGQDGNKWVIMKNKNGVKRWQCIKNSKNKTNTFRSKRLIKNKTIKNKSKINIKKINESNNANKVWGNYGKVFSPKKKKYVRIGGNESFNIIRNELNRDVEWIKRVQHMANMSSPFGNKMKTLL